MTRIAALLMAFAATLGGAACEPQPCPIRPGSDYRHNTWYDAQNRAYATSPSEDSPLTCIVLKDK
jgi:hypothetical protein